MLSSSTTDSNTMEVIIENNSNVNNRNLISTRKQNGVLNGNNSLLNIVPPGQVVPISNTTTTTTTTIKTNSFEQINAAAKLQADSQPSADLTDSNAKRLTQGIAAIAAQRKAYQHHRELMQELGHHEAKVLLRLKSPTLKQQQQQQIEENRLIEPINQTENSVLNDGLNSKTKKQVKIKEIVQYKLPDDEDNNYSTVKNLNFSSNFKN